MSSDNSETGDRTEQDRLWNRDVYFTSDLNRNWQFVFKSVKYSQTKEQQYYNKK